MSDRLQHPAVVAVPALLTVAHVARILDRTRSHVYKRIRSGDLRAVDDHGRIMVRGDDLAAYIDAMAPVVDDAITRRAAHRRRRPSDRYPYLRA